jgi:hypothetical protein
MGDRQREASSSRDGPATLASNGCATEPKLDRVRRTYAYVAANGGMPP